MEIWTKLDTWNEQVYAWKSEDFRALEVEEMVKEVQIMFKDALKMSKKPGADGMPDPIVMMFKERYVPAHARAHTHTTTCTHA